MSVPALQVRLRQWRDDDLDAFAAMNRDHEVMRYFPALLTREQSKEALLRHKQFIDQRGWGFWAVEADGAFAGFTGLNVPGCDAPFMPCVEIAWRLRRDFWGQSVAFRAALQALQYGFDVLHLHEIVAFTAVQNERSRRLMVRLGFIRDANGDFDHPLIPLGHDLRRHVLYRLSR